MSFSSKQKANVLDLRARIGFISFSIRSEFESLHCSVHLLHNHCLKASFYLISVLHRTSLLDMGHETWSTKSDGAKIELQRVAGGLPRWVTELWPKLFCLCSAARSRLPLTCSSGCLGTTAQYAEGGREFSLGSVWLGCGLFSCIQL